MLARFAIPFFFLMTLVVVPLLLALLCRRLAPRRWWRWMALAITVAVWAVVGYGYSVGYEQMEVHHVEFASSDLPASFDGYRIVQFSDAHIGTMTGPRRWLLQRAVDSINALHPDLIVFTGDMQNVYPDELPPHIATLRQLKARDGVLAVLGNHDYAVYQNVHPAIKAQNCEKTKEHLRAMGFDLLLNEHRIIRRDTDSIVVAGMENWGIAERMPHEGDVARTLAGLACQPSAADAQHAAAAGRPSSPFILMLQHDPTCWREHILPECRAQLTLSGHTHGGQMALLGLSPASLAYSEWGGMYREGDRALFVSTGLGALIPFRLGMPGEIAVVTLKAAPLQTRRNGKK
ncbi:MAG: metallophosphoesterase [Prevotella sp.]|nr:metallophosphoesterase [Prevotella sp.]